MTHPRTVTADIAVHQGRRRRFLALSALLNRPTTALWLALLSIVLTLPSLGVGWVVDDQFHRLRFVGSAKLPEIRANPSELFNFSDGDPVHVREAVNRGLWPWWTLETIHASFWRPLTVLTHWIDYHLWPNSAILMHAQSIAWLAALAAVTTLLYRQVLGATFLAGLAALFYAVDDARGMPVGFLANRNAIVAAFFGMLAIYAHVRWRRQGSMIAAICGPCLLAASLLSAEAGLGTIAYLGAYSFCLESGSWRRRLLVLLPYGVVVIVWRVAWTLTGHGIHGVGLYVDPLTEPLRFMMEAAQRAPILLLGQLAFPPADAGMAALLLGFLPVYALVATVLLIWIGAMVWPSLRHDRIARFWAVGMILSLAPICATFSSDRLLLFVGFGAFGLIAQFLTLRPTGRRRLVVFLIAIHGVIAPLGLLLRSAMPVGPKSIMESMLVNTPMDASVEKQTVILVTAPIAFATTYLPVNRALDGLPVPARVRMLASYQPPIVVERLDARTLVVRPTGGFLKLPFDQLARSPAYPMKLGQRVEIAGMIAEVVAMTDDGRPSEVRFQFDVPLEDASLRWLNWSGRDYVPFTPPGIGESITIQ